MIGIQNEYLIRYGLFWCSGENSTTKTGFSYLLISTINYITINVV